MFFIKLIIPLLIFNGLNISENKEIINLKNFKNKFIFDVSKLNDNILDKSFNIHYKNDAKTGKYNYNNNFFVYGEDINKMKNQLFFSQVSKENEMIFNYSTCFQELEKSVIEFSNNKFKLKISDVYREFNYLEKCGQKHSSLIPKCGLDHIHNRSCMKSYLYDRTGCLPVTKKLKYNLAFNQEEFNDYLKSRIIDNKIFNFSKLLNFDKDESIKFFNKNIVSFSFNEIYLKSIIINSFNNYFANEFEKLYKNKIDNDILNLIIENIKINKITSFEHYVTKFLKININNYSFKHNIQYWLDLLEYKDKSEIIHELNNLKETDFSLYIKKYKLEQTNNYIWKQLYIFFNNKENLKNVFFNINYKTKLNSSHPSKKISIFDLIEKNNSFISYKFSNSELDHNFNEQAIHISNIYLSSSSNYSYTQINNIGINMFNNNWENIQLPLENKPNTWLTFNPKINYSKIININNISKTVSKDFLFKNNITGYPSDNINANFFNIVCNLNKTIYISFLDKELLNTLNENDLILNSYFFKKYIKDITITPFDSLGEIKITINFKDDTYSFFSIKGFNAKIISHTNINKEIELSKLNTNELSSIDNNYILNNIISYQDYNPINSMVYINTSKTDFETNILNSIKLILSSKNILLIDIEYKNKISDKNKIELKIIDSKNSINNNNDKNLETEKNNKSKIIFFSISTSILLIVIFILSTIIFLKHKKRRKIENTKIS